MSEDQILKNFVKERNVALFSLDEKKIRAYMRKYDIEPEGNELIFWASVYKGICNITSAPADKVAIAMKWLTEHGMSPEIG